MINSNKKKKQLGQYFTINNYWLQPQIVSFIESCNKHKMLDPFAGNGDLIDQCKQFNFSEYCGLDIDKSLGWQYNDSLMDIPYKKDFIVITNPPYLYVSSKSNTKETKKYFIESLKDLYLVALRNILKKYEYCVAIIPGSFFKCCVNFPFVRRLVNITYITKNVFKDTTCPICVACFDNRYKEFKDIKCYVDDEYINDYDFLNRFNYKYNKKVNIINSNSGWLGCKLIDDIHFDFSEKFSKYYKTTLSHRRYYVKFEIPNIKNKQELINKLNDKLENMRIKTKDLIILPFKSADRRRLTLAQAKGIIEEVIIETNFQENRLWEDILSAKLNV